MNKDRKGNVYIPTKHSEGNGDNMPTVEKVNYEMTDYLQDIKDYIANYRNLPKNEAKRQAKKNLMDAGIIDEQGNLTGFYRS